MLTANRAVAHLVAGAEPMLLRPPVNFLRLFLPPAGLASRIVNLAQWQTQVLERLRRQADASGDPLLTDLLEEIRDDAEEPRASGRAADLMQRLCPDRPLRVLVLRNPPRFTRQRSLSHSY